MSKKTIYDEYEKYTKEYQNQYGPRTVVLYQCGSFYEIYSANDGLINIKEITELLNIQVTRRDKAVLDINRINYNMAGFPTNALKKFINILVNAKYTVVIVEQISQPPKPKRTVTDIISAGTKIDDIKTFETNILMVIYFELFEIWKSKKKSLSIGLSLIDLTTGISKVTEIHSTKEDLTYALDELYKLIIFYNPKEVILTSIIDIKYTYDFLIKTLELTSIYTHDCLEKYPKEMIKITYQEQILKKIYIKTGLLSVFEYINLEKLPIATLSFVYLLQFCHQHNNSILNNICIPQVITAENKCILSYNCAKQLNINNLCDILNKCQTSMGKRSFREKLLNPEIDPDIINKKYQIISNIINDINNNKDSDICKYFKNIYDLERLTRKISLKKLHPADILQILSTLEATIELDKYLPIADKNINQQISQIINELKSTFNTNEIGKYYIDSIEKSIDADTNIFISSEKYKLIDEYQTQYKYHINKLGELANKIRSDNTIKIENNDRDGYYFLITKKRYKEALSQKSKLQIEYNKKIYQILISDFEVKAVSGSSSNNKLFHKLIGEIEKNVLDIKQKLVKQITEEYFNVLSEIDAKYNLILLQVCKHIIDIDWYVSCAKNAIKYKYQKPIIENKYESQSFIDLKSLRHPVIEQIIGQQDYIANDIKLGTSELNGMLLYGVNSSGKSSICKAIAICIIMAQAGMFVPCSNMVFWPYKQIFTRIPSGDDMMKGQSTFVVEISELRNILKRANKNSLVIGDELASGTESVSALSIVSAGIIQLLDIKASFIFATHLHDICKIDKIKKINGLRICHLTVNYDGTKLIYDRILKDGPGDTIYGLEVCKSLGLSISFMNLANEIRNDIIGNGPNICPIKKSKYNKKLYLDKCKICGQKAIEVHHIKQQILADNKGFIDHIHKNKLENLVSICDKCHDEIHRGNIIINGYKQTSDGIELLIN